MGTTYAQGTYLDACAPTATYANANAYLPGSSASADSHPGTYPDDTCMSYYYAHAHGRAPAHADARDAYAFFHHQPSYPQLHLFRCHHSVAVGGLHPSNTNPRSNASSSSSSSSSSRSGPGTTASSHRGSLDLGPSAWGSLTNRKRGDEGKEKSSRQGRRKSHGSRAGSTGLGIDHTRFRKILRLDEYCPACEEVMEREMMGSEAWLHVVGQSSGAEGRRRRRLGKENGEWAGGRGQ